MYMLRQIQGHNADTFGRYAHGSRDLDRPTPELDAPFFQQVIESSPSPILVMDVLTATQTIVYVNPAFESLLGYSRHEVVGRDWRVFVSADTLDEGAQARAGLPSEETLVAIRKDGAQLHLKMTFSHVCDDDGVAVQYVAVLHDVTAELRLREGLEYRACHDSLTGLANRYLLRDRFEHAAAQAQRHGTRYTLTLLDLDGFKQINDRFGHAVGDEALAFLGARMLDLVRSEDTAARLGGDEFVLLLMDADQESTRLILKRLGRALASFSPAGLGPFGLSLSAGVALFPDDGKTLETMLGAADKRLYAAKS